MPGLPEADEPDRWNHLSCTKLPLTVWFQAMHLLTQGKHSVSALELKRQLGVHYETAWAMKQQSSNTASTGVLTWRRSCPACSMWPSWLQPCRSRF